MERLHIAFLGPVNSGKSSLINAICGQEVSMVSPVAGTTTDPVRKLAELPGLGPCVLIDTPGLGDDSQLGPERERLTRRILDEADIAVVLLPPGFGTGHFPGPGTDQVHAGVQRMDPYVQKVGENAPEGPADGPLRAPLPTIYVASKADLSGPIPPDVLPVSAVTGEGIPALLKRLASLTSRQADGWLTGSLVKAGDCVLLVMPQDSEAPKGRLILPQVQVLRELLDRGCVPVCCTPGSLADALSRVKPDLVITDSQVFAAVNAALDPQTPLTSFSVLLAGAKGDIRTFVDGARAMDRLQPGDRVLIAEACTHVPNTEDIGRVKIPELLRKKISPLASLGRNDRENVGRNDREDLIIDIAAGNDFPEDLTPYALIIHCGACVTGGALVQRRMRKALLAGVPITNYGIALAKLQGMLDRIALP